MNLNKIWVWGIFAVLGGLGTAIPVYAKECVLNQSKFDALSSVDDSQNYFQKLRQELAVRKQLISKTITCAIEEGSALKAGVDQDIFENTEGQKAGSKISNLLENAIEYYKLQLTKVSDLGLEGSRYFAKDLLTWRQGNYTPIAKTASIFILWSKNQGLLDTARNRLNHIGGAVTILKLIDNESVQKKWQAANALFNNALAQDQNAQRSLESLDPPDNTLALIKLSLASLSDAYKTLSDVVAEINALTSKIQGQEEK